MPLASSSSWTITHANARTGCAHCTILSPFRVMGPTILAQPVANRGLYRDHHGVAPGALSEGIERERRSRDGLRSRQAVAGAGSPTRTTLHLDDEVAPATGAGAASNRAPESGRSPFGQLLRCGEYLEPSQHRLITDHRKNHPSATFQWAAIDGRCTITTRRMPDRKR